MYIPLASQCFEVVLLLYEALSCPVYMLLKYLVHVCAVH